MVTKVLLTRYYCSHLHWRVLAGTFTMTGANRCQRVRVNALSLEVNAGACASCGLETRPAPWLGWSAGQWGHRSGDGNSMAGTQGN